jgi:nicotinamidase-related amidase
MTDIAITPATTALVLIDLQRGITSGKTVPHTTAEVVAHGAKLAKACRAAGVLVVLVRVEVGPSGVLFPVVTADVPRAPFSVPEGWADIVPELGPERGDVVVTKHQPNAFFGTDIDIQLSRRGIRTILLGGISTNVGVEATARAANERGYNQIFVEDAMAAREADLHDFPTRRYFPTIGCVRSTDDVLAALAAVTK